MASRASNYAAGTKCDAAARATVKLVRLNEGGFFDALRTKLSWGEL